MKLLYPNAQLRHVSFSNSDHEAIIINVHQDRVTQGSKPNRFRLENIWLHNEGVEDIIKIVWALPQQGSLMFQLTQRIKVFRVTLI
jgi:hypothetical protein